MNNNSNNVVLLFNQNQHPCHYQNLYIKDLYSVLTESIIADGYFFMQWLFPVQGVSKWHTHTVGLTDNEVDIIRNSSVIKNHILTSAKFILNYYQLMIMDNQICYAENLTSRNYWLRGIGHEEKKLSRIMLSLKLCGFDELAYHLQQVSIDILKQKGFKTDKNPQDTIKFWQNIFIKKQLY